MDRQPLILVVETEPQNLRLLSEHLKSWNFSCICAKEGIKTLIVAQTHQPNLILLDMKLPDLSSIQVVDYLKRNPETAMIPIIGITNITKNQDLNPLLLAGAECCITKPYNFQELRQTINRYLILQPSYY